MVAVWSEGEPPAVAAAEREIHGTLCPDCEVLRVRYSLGHTAVVCTREGTIRGRIKPRGSSSTYHFVEIRLSDGQVLNTAPIAQSAARQALVKELLDYGRHLLATRQATIDLRTGEVVG
jgi:hypothetical protein